MWGLAQIRADAMCEAAVLLAMRGYDNVHASELAEASRLSVGSLYRIYGSKRGFALSVRDMSESTLCRRARISFEIEHGRPGVDFREAFFSFWRGLVAEALKEPALFAFTFLHWHPLSDGPRERYVRGPYLPRSLGPVAEDTSDADAPDARRYTRGSDGPYAPDVGGEEPERYARDFDAPRPPRALGPQSHGRAARALVREVLEYGEREGALAPGSARVGEGLVWGALLELVRAPAEEGALVTDAEVLASATVLWRALASAGTPGPVRLDTPPSGTAPSQSESPARFAEAPTCMSLGASASELTDRCGEASESNAALSEETERRGNASSSAPRVASDSGAVLPETPGCLGVRVSCEVPVLLEETSSCAALAASDSSAASSGTSGGVSEPEGRRPREIRWSVSTPVSGVRGRRASCTRGCRVRRCLRWRGLPSPSIRCRQASPSRGSPGRRSGRLPWWSRCSPGPSST